MKQVDCSDVRDAFRAGTVPVDPEVDAHVRGCVRCAELFADEARLGKALATNTGSSMPNEELWTSIEAVIQVETGWRAWLRSRPTGQRLVFVLIAALMAIGLAAFKLRADWAAYPGDSVLAWLSAYSVGVLVSLWLLLAPLGRPRPPLSVLTGLGIVALALPFAYAFGLLAPVVHAADRASADEVLRRAVRCFTFGLAITLPFLAVTWAVERGDRVPPGKVLLAGAAGGLVANLALLLHCPLNDETHLLLGHAPIGVATFLALAVIFRISTRRTVGGRTRQPH